MHGYSQFQRESAKDRYERLIREVPQAIVSMVGIVSEEMLCPGRGRVSDPSCFLVALHVTDTISTCGVRTGRRPRGWQKLTFSPDASVAVPHLGTVCVLEIPRRNDAGRLCFHGCRQWNRHECCWILVCDWGQTGHCGVKVFEFCSFYRWMDNQLK